MLDEIKCFYDDSERVEPDSPLLTIVKGPNGSGKTAFAKHLIENLHECPEFQGYINSHRGGMPIFTSSIDPETQLHYFGAWKPII